MLASLMTKLAKVQPVEKPTEHRTLTDVLFSMTEDSYVVLNMVNIGGEKVLSVMVRRHRKYECDGIAKTVLTREMIETCKLDTLAHTVKRMLEEVSR